MKINYPSNFHDLIKELPLAFDPFGDLSDDAYCTLLETVSDYLLMKGINREGDGVNGIGAMCESLLDWLADQEEM